MLGLARGAVCVLDLILGGVWVVSELHLVLEVRVLHPRYHYPLDVLSIVTRPSHC